MQAAYYERFGPAVEVLQIGELPNPVPRAGEVRVRVHWSGVNPSDVKTRAGRPGRALPFPRIVPHSDGMGVIDVVGAGVDPQRIGQRVWLWNAGWERPMGSAAQFVALPEVQAVPLPEGVPDEAGACLGIPALTAMHATLCNGGVANKTVLVAGGAGSVGHYAVQFARRLGAAKVLTTVSNDAKAELAMRAGADIAINYKAENWAQRVREETDGRGIDRIIEVDIAGNGVADVEALALGGEIVAYGTTAPEFSLSFSPLILKGIRLQFFIVYQLSTQERSTAIAALHQMLQSSDLIHNVAARFTLNDIARAHETVAQGGAVGNVVVEVT